MTRFPIPRSLGLAALVMGPVTAPLAEETPNVPAAPLTEKTPPESDGLTVIGRDTADALPDDRAASTVTRGDMDRRLPRSAPDALRYEPGVFVQQTAHGQASAFIRGLTGQQTLMMFDGIRLNNSVYRQGPNQYFFTLDSRTIDSIEVERGGASTRWGSDALGGVIDAHPIEPTRVDEGLRVEPRLFGRGATADSEYGGRLQLDAAYVASSGVQYGVIGGYGRRHVGLLRGRPVLNPDRGTDAGVLPWVPRYREYEPTKPVEDQVDALRTQLGTGFEERTWDARFVVRPDARDEITLAAYAYRQSDAPRTDQCAPPTAPYDQCLTYEQQYRDLVYWAWHRTGSEAALADLRTTFSWQRQHEQRRFDLTSANKVGHGVNDVDTYGTTARARTRPFHLAEGVALTVDYGLDNYYDLIGSRADHGYVDTGDTVIESRGQYIEGSTSLYGGFYTDLETALGERWITRAGGRISWAKADAEPDPESGTLGLHRFWVPFVWHAGVEYKAAPPLRLFLNYDASFRAPNLDDMTSRQQTGPGFQFENADLEPETAHTFELGGRLRLPFLVADAWVFETILEDAVLKVSKTAADCPPNTAACNGAWSRLKLQNSPTYAELRGAEGAAKVFLPLHLSLRGTVSYVWTEGPRVGIIGYGGGDQRLDDRVPLSKTPPLNGTGELMWSHPEGVSAGAAVQWATMQDRLAVADYSDGRIPKYGTPGFAVMHLRGAYRWREDLLLAAVFENVFDSAWRFHGSSVNGPERGLMIQLEAGHAFGAN